MTWTAIARKDFQDALRSKALWALTVLFVLVAGGFAYLYTLVQEGQGGGGSGALTSLDFVFFLQGAVSLVVPLIALIIGYKSVAGEIESGSVKLLLSLPHRRRDVVFGKVVGRTAVLTVSIVIGLLAAAAVVLALYADFSLGNYLLFSGLTVLFGLAYVSIAVGVSASTKSTTWATAGAVGVFVLFYVLWDFIAFGINYLLNGEFFINPVQPPEWYVAYLRLSPNGAYSATMTGFLPREGTVSALFPQGDVPFYLTDWFALLILLAWIAVPVAVGYLRFQRADL